MPMVRLAQIAVSCVWTAPLGSPVVPEVYMM